MYSITNAFHKPRHNPPYGSVTLEPMYLPTCHPPIPTTSSIPLPPHNLPPQPPQPIQHLNTNIRHAPKPQPLIKRIPHRRRNQRHQFFSVPISCEVHSPPNLPRAKIVPIVRGVCGEELQVYLGCGGVGVRYVVLLETVELGFVGVHAGFVCAEGEGAIFPDAGEGRELGPEREEWGLEVDGG